MSDYLNNRSEPRPSRFFGISVILYSQLICLALATLGTIYSRAHLTHEYWQLGRFLAPHEELIEIGFTIGVIGLVVCPISLAICARQWLALRAPIRAAFMIAETLLLLGSHYVLLPAVQ